MTQSQHTIKRAVFVGLFAVVGCSPELGQYDSEPNAASRKSAWPTLLTNAQIVALKSGSVIPKDEASKRALALAARAAALKTRAARLARKDVLTNQERRLLQNAAAQGQP